MIDFYPEVIKGYCKDTGDVSFVLEAFDEYAALLTIEKEIVTVDSWQEISKAITDALVSMKLKQNG